MLHIIDYKVGDTVNLLVREAGATKFRPLVLLKKYERFWLFDAGGYKTCALIRDIQAGREIFLY